MTLARCTSRDCRPTACKRDDAHKTAADWLARSAKDGRGVPRRRPSPGPGGWGAGGAAISASPTVRWRDSIRHCAQQSPSPLVLDPPLLPDPPPSLPLPPPQDGRHQGRIRHRHDAHGRAEVHRPWSVPSSAAVGLGSPRPTFPGALARFCRADLDAFPVSLCQASPSSSCSVPSRTLSLLQRSWGGREDRRRRREGLPSEPPRRGAAAARSTSPRGLRSCRRAHR